MTGIRAEHHKRIEHEFHHENLSYDAGIHYQSCVKVSVFFKKLPNISYDHFYKHWGMVHADLSVASKGFHVYKIERYTQVVETPWLVNCMSSYHLIAPYEDFENMMKSTREGGLADDAKYCLDSATISIFAG
ncbi:hypothetical protein AJ80_05958 [Polytolypa hystricis UAMH7299]|uniref:EthD domain-containing protein n=1 Tax=Polytolypa hystricis (strain UAMH7299) TaxID=1447883 RepID=A0A2B7Y0P5_POLH7|nr:hypothetical protein AJ80_05958 [Polytolypa hystricis UAMH7299]